MTDTYQPDAATPGEVRLYVPKPELDLNEYLPLIHNLNLPQDEKIAFIYALWDVMGSVVRMQHGIDGVVPAFQKAIERVKDETEEVIPAHEFNVAATDPTRKAD